MPIGYAQPSYKVGIEESEKQNLVLKPYLAVHIYNPSTQIDKKEGF